MRRQIANTSIGNKKNRYSLVCCWTDVNPERFAAGLEFIGYRYVVAEHAITGHHHPYHSCQHRSCVNSYSHLKLKEVCICHFNYIVLISSSDQTFSFLIYSRFELSHFDRMEDWKDFELGKKLANKLNWDELWKCYPPRTYLSELRRGKRALRQFQTNCISYVRQLLLHFRSKQF